MQPAREGDLILILMNVGGWASGYWGKGATYKDALEEARREAGMTYTEARGSKKTVLSVHPKASVDVVTGAVISPKGHTPIVLAKDKQQ